METAHSTGPEKAKRSHMRGIHRRNVVRVKAVGWVERSETHQMPVMVGPASLDPPYAHSALFHSGLLASSVVDVKYLHSLARDPVKILYGYRQSGMTRTPARCLTSSALIGHLPMR